MVKFSIPYNSDLAVIKEIISKYKAKIEEVYFPIDNTVAITSKKYAANVSRNEAIQLIKILKRSKIKSNILINGAYQGNRDPEGMKNFIKAIGGVDAITIADLYLLKVFKDFGPRLHISRLAQLNSVEKNRRILTRYPSLTINIDNDLNRDIRALKYIYSLKKTFPDFRVKLMLNEGCLFHCTGRTRHSWLLCIDEQEKRHCGGYFSCFNHVSLQEVAKEMVKSAFIRPEDLYFYRQNKVVDVFKIAGRQKNPKELMAIVDAYMKESYNGPLAELMGTGVMRNFSKKYFFDVQNEKFPKDFIRKVAICDKVCLGCDYCQNVAQKTIALSDGAVKKIKAQILSPNN